jgi:glycosyltransferase involved in cell wall biosynthesis
MKNNPAFTLVIPTYNRAAFITKTLDSVCKQTFSDFEVIIVDDGSTDNTQQVVEKYLADNRFRYFKKVNAERAAARNYGILLANGNYITFLDSDDYLLPYHFEIANSKINSNNELKVFHLGYEIFNGINNIYTLPELPNPVNRALIDGNHLSCLGVFIKNEIAKENLFDENRDLSGSEDFELWIRIAMKYPIYTFSEITSRLINHDSRSVNAIDVQKLQKRLDLLEEKVINSLNTNSEYVNEKNKFISFRMLYQALHLAVAGYKREAIRETIKAINSYPKCILTYRFGTIIKKVLIN